MHDDPRQREAAERHKRMLEHHLEKPPLHTGNPAESQADRERAAMAPDQWTVRRAMAGWLYVLLIGLIVVIGITALVLFLGPWRRVHPVEASEGMFPAPAGERLPLAVGGQEFASGPGDNLADA